MDTVQIIEAYVDGSPEVEYRWQRLDGAGELIELSDPFPTMRDALIDSARINAAPDVPVLIAEPVLIEDVPAPVSVD